MLNYFAQCQHIPASSNPFMPAEPSTRSSKAARAAATDGPAAPAARPSNGRAKNGQQGAPPATKRNSTVKPKKNTAPPGEGGGRTPLSKVQARKTIPNNEDVSTALFFRSPCLHACSRIPMPMLVPTTTLPQRRKFERSKVRWLDRQPQWFNKKLKLKTDLVFHPQPVWQRCKKMQPRRPRLVTKTTKMAVSKRSWPLRGLAAKRET